MLLFLGGKYNVKVFFTTSCSFLKVLQCKIDIYKFLFILNSAKDKVNHKNIVIMHHKKSFKKTSMQLMNNVVERIYLS